MSLEGANFFNIAVSKIDIQDVSKQCRDFHVFKQDWQQQRSMLPKAAGPCRAQLVLSPTTGHRTPRHEESQKVCGVEGPSDGCHDGVPYLNMLFI
jgi:hypothetical protein